MLKKNKISFFIITAILFALLSYFFIRMNGDAESDGLSNLIILNHLNKKFEQYYSLPELRDKKKFRAAFEKSWDSLKSIDGKIKMIGERTKLTDSHILLQQFVLYDKNGKFFAKYLNTSDQHFTSKVQGIPIVTPQLSIQCDSHYFYLPNSSNVDSGFNGYSLLQINGNRMSDIKILFSDKFDSFINVKTMCGIDDTKAIISYINKQFDFQK